MVTAHLPAKLGGCSDDPTGLFDRYVPAERSVMGRSAIYTQGRYAMGSTGVPFTRTSK